MFFLEFLKSVRRNHTPVNPFELGQTDLGQRKIAEQKVQYLTLREEKGIKF